MIQLTELKSLLLTHPAQPNRPSHLSAASGLVQVGSWLYVMADDELHIGKFSLEGDSAGELYPCFPGNLPINAEERKAEKPDIEVLIQIPHFSNPSQQVLLALGSGSKKNRYRGAIIPLNQQGHISAPADIIDLSYFYEFLKKEIGSLNIEGAAIVRNNIFLFQRGNKKNKLNASIRIALDDFYRIVSQPHQYYEPDIVVTAYDLGEIDQVPYCFTDAASLDTGEIVFIASAENTDDSYLDGTCMGSAIGVINTQGKLVFLEPVDKKIKLEGIAATTKRKTIELLLVSDADDVAQPAKLYSAKITL